MSHMELHIIWPIYEIYGALFLYVVRCCLEIRSLVKTVIKLKLIMSYYIRLILALRNLMNWRIHGHRFHGRNFHDRKIFMKRIFCDIYLPLTWKYSKKFELMQTKLFHFWQSIQQIKFFVSDFYTLGYIVDDLSSFGLHMSGSKWHLTLYFYERKVEKLIGKVSDVNDKLLLKTFFEIVISVTGATYDIF